MPHPFPSPSLQPVHPSSALSRLGPATSPAPAGSQQAINMLKEQNRLLTKVSGVQREKIPFAGWETRQGGNPRQWKVFLQLGQPWSLQRRACRMQLESPCHAAV